MVESLGELNMHIDELMSEDAALRLAAATKIPQIVSALSPARVEGEFLPYLRYVIEAQDNEDEFLVRLCEHLRKSLEGRANFKKDGAVQIYECLCVLEDPRLRAAAQQGLVALAGEAGTLVLQAVGRLALCELPSARLSALEIIAQLAAGERPPRQMLSEIDRIVSLLADDAQVAVRRGYLRALGAMLRRAEPFAGLLCVSEPQLTAVAGLLSKRESESVLFDLFHPSLLEPLHAALAPAAQTRLLSALRAALSSEELSWRVRVIVVENYQLILLLWREAPAKTADALARQWASPEPDLRAGVTRLLAAVVAACTAAAELKLFEQHLAAQLDLHLQTERHPGAKRQLVFLCKAQRSAGMRFDPAVAQRSLEQFERLLADADSSVRMQALEFLREFLLDPPGQTEALRVFDSLAGEKNWKLRLAALECIGSALTVLARKAPLDADALQALLDANARFAGDLVLRNRQKLAENLALASPWLAEGERARAWSELLGLWARNSNHIYRISALQALPRIVPLLPPRPMAALLAAAFDALRAETVINVKINMLKTLLALRPQFDAAALAGPMTIARASCGGESDTDVKDLLVQL